MSEVEYAVVFNDGSELAAERLFAMRRIVCEQLPNMPKDYVVRVLLDRHHRALCVLRAGRVIGGVVFRPFHSQAFAEIVFLAIAESEKHSGFGTKILNHAKEHVKKEGIRFFLTYADNTAIGFFVKMGFTKKKSMVRPRWEGFIKDYVRSTLMECKIMCNVDYIRVKETLQLQKAAVLKKMSEYSKSQVVYPGLSFWNELPEGTDSKRIPLESVPGLKEAGWKSSAAAKAPVRVNSLQTFLSNILSQLVNMKTAWPFLRPVTIEEAPSYFDVIKKPMDLGTMQKKLNDGLYATKEEFEADFKLIISNCKKFNDSDTIYVKLANALEKKYIQLMKPAKVSL